MAKEHKLIKEIRAAVYTRVSSDRQIEGFSLEAQEDLLMQEIGKRGWVFHELYTDPGESGGNLDRPGVQKLIKDMKDHKFDALIIHKLDRLTRNMGDLYFLIDLINKLDIRLIINGYSEQIDTKSTMGKIFIYMTGIFAEIYLDNLREEIYKGLSKRAAKGLRSNPNAPYGYENGDNLKLILKEEEATVVRQMYAWRIEGWGRNKIARNLNSRGITSKTGVQWSEKMIDSVLGNLTYTGAAHWKKADDPEEKRIIVRDMHEAIVDIETFEQVQKIKERVRDGFMSTSPYDFPFSTIVKCAICGRSYNGKMSKYKETIYHGYRCNGKGRASMNCEASEITESKLVKLLMARIDVISDASLDVDKVIEPTKIDVEKERKRITKKMADSKERRMKWAKAMGDNKMSYDEYSMLIDGDQAQLAQLQKELDQLPEKNVSKGNRKEIVDRLLHIRNEWDNMSNVERKRSLAMMFNRIVIGKINNVWKILAYELNE
ncbi:recombinase family protein [Paenibacillus qinlingensis]|uniref:Site-specific DNA recombinase n=1 Tax=Paenibacillus qinlingensis TaxID=1837343 RepID=A0ABU1P6V5_9BACL|nr:recombinase family protein [Paenibacillus qinlingensis]MDR6555498.1 site-specific DNA recombinase [Paenibacillus qinlingensis]